MGNYIAHKRYKPRKEVAPVTVDPDRMAAVEARLQQERERQASSEMIRSKTKALGMYQRAHKKQVDAEARRRWDSMEAETATELKKYLPLHLMSDFLDGLPKRRHPINGGMPVSREFSVGTAWLEMLCGDKVPNPKILFPEATRDFFHDVYLPVSYDQLRAVHRLYVWFTQAGITDAAGYKKYVKDSYFRLLYWRKAALEDMPFAVAASTWVNLYHHVIQEV